MDTAGLRADLLTGDETGARQSWSAEGYAANARFVAELGVPVLEWLAPARGGRILDLGCGDGALTQRIVGAGARVVGVDASTSLLAAARSLGLDVQLMDGHALAFEHEFDAVFSNAALHWMLQPRKVISGVAQALKQGGRFVGEFGGHGNVAAIVTALRAVAGRHGVDPATAMPWFYPTPAEYSALLEEAGFLVHRIELIPRPTPLPTGLRGWLATFAQPFFDQFGADRELALDDVELLLAPSLRDRAGQWSADYVRLRFEARL